MGSWMLMCHGVNSEAHLRLNCLRQALGLQRALLRIQFRRWCSSMMLSWCRGWPITPQTAKAGCFCPVVTLPAGHQRDQRTSVRFWTLLRRRCSDRFPLHSVIFYAWVRGTWPPQPESHHPAEMWCPCRWGRTWGGKARKRCQCFYGEVISFTTWNEFPSDAQ